MDAYNKFSNLLHQIETSELNYMVSKTPFSATISLKSSFAKKFKYSAIKKEESKDVQIDATSDTEDTKRIAAENQILKEAVKQLEESIVVQNETLEKRTSDFKAKLKANDDEISALRADLLKVKKEKNQGSTNLKQAKDDVEKLNVLVVDLKKEAQQSDLKVKDLNETHNKAKEDVKKEKDLAEKNNFKQNAELRILKQKLEKLAHAKFDCYLCDYKGETSSEVRDHVRLAHSRNKSLQVEAMEIEQPFCEYPHC